MPNFPALRCTLCATLLAAACLPVLGCAAPPGAGHPASRPVFHAQESASRDNRDRHGPGNVERYIARLQRADRVAELQPDLVIARLAPAEDALVADIGSGPGVFALPFARRVSRGVVYAVDVEPRQLDALRARIREQGIENIVPVLASYSDPHLPPGRMDLIFIADTYHHLENRVAYLERLRADLAPGGRLAIVEYKPGDLPVGPPASHKISVEQRASELHAAGFELVTRFDTHQYHDFEVWRPANGR